MIYPKQHFQTIQYTGNGNSQRIGGEGVGASTNAPAYTVPYALKVTPANVTSLYKAFGSSPTTYTCSFWFKRSAASAVNDQILIGSRLSGATANYLALQANGTLHLGLRVGGTFDAYSTTALSDFSKWYHLTLSVAANGYAYVYVDGVSVASIAVNSTPYLFYSGWGATSNQICQYGDFGGSTYVPNGYISEFVYVSDQQLTPDHFAYTDSNGQWSPKQFTGSYGSEGFYLSFTDLANFGKDSSGNNNNWTATGFVAADRSIDSPTNNFPTLNWGHKGSAVVLMDGALKHTVNGSGWGFAGSTMLFPAESSNFYCEVTVVSHLSGNGLQVGITQPNIPAGATNWGNTDTYGYGYYDDGRKLGNGSNTGYGASFTTAGDVVGIWINNGSLTFFKNGVSQGVAYSGITGTYMFAISEYGPNNIVKINFGQTAFAYTPPAGAKTLCSQNITTPPTGVMVPDFAIIKSLGAGQWSTASMTRGWQKLLPIASASETTAAESTDLTSITSSCPNGLLLGSSTTVNTNTTKYVAYMFKAGGVPVTNAQGSIPSVVSANNEAGFSIVNYKGTGGNGTVGHGLSRAPSLVMYKNRGSADHWTMYMAAVPTPATTGVYLSSNLAAVTGATTLFNSTVPSASVLTVGSSASTNGTGADMDAYCWYDVPGYSKFGTFVGNGRTDGNFIYLGFKPALFAFKALSVNAAWVVYDNAKTPYNDNVFKYNSFDQTVATSSNIVADFVSDGIVIRSTPGSNYNGAGTVHVFIAFAEAPLKYATAR